MNHVIYMGFSLQVITSNNYTEKDFGRLNRWQKEKGNCKTGVIVWTVYKISISRGVKAGLILEFGGIDPKAGLEGTKNITKPIKLLTRWNWIMFNK